MASRSLPHPTAVLREAWRRLRTMRTAIILLLVLAAGAAVGSIFPQWPVSPLAVMEWQERYPGWAPLAERLGLHDVFGAWWFMAIYALLLVSLAGCLAPRSRAWLRALRRRPRPRPALSGIDRYATAVAPAAPEEALAGAERLLRRRRFRTVRTNGQVAAEKGHLREGGSLVFHTAFFVLLVGVAVGKLFGFEGQVAIIEGERTTDTPVAYNNVREGRLFEGYTGMEIALDRFDVSWYPDGVPREFVSHVRVLEDGEEVRSAEIRVNHPMRHRGRTFYQIAWGWAPRITVEQEGRILADGEIVFIDNRGAGIWEGVLKAPGARPAQMGLEAWLYNDLDLTDDGVPFNRSPEPRRPVIFFREYRGDLRLDRPQSVFTLDKTALAPGEFGMLGLGETVTLPDGITIAFRDLATYSVLQVSRDPGTGIVLLAAVLILAALVPSLYAFRRQVWVRAFPAGGSPGTLVEVAGVALQRQAAFEGEFTAVMRQLGRELRIGAEAGEPAGAHPNGPPAVARVNGSQEAPQGHQPAPPQDQRPARPPEDAAGPAGEEISTQGAHHHG